MQDLLAGASVVATCKALLKELYKPFLKPLKTLLINWTIEAIGCWGRFDTLTDL